MTVVVFFIEQVALGLYILLGAGMLWMLLRWSRARRQWRSTAFELERDMYRYQQANALTTLILLVEAGLIVLGVQQVVAPTLRQASPAATAAIAAAVDAPFATPTLPNVSLGSSPIDASGVIIDGGQEIGRVQVTAVPTPTPVGTILPNPPPVDGCETPNAQLQVPANGMLVFEPMRVIGTAFSDDFSFYRFEISGPSTLGSFALLAEYTQPATAMSDLGQFVPAFYEPGRYEFRLTVFDINRTLRAACKVTITISAPVPTATPLGSE